MLETAEERIKLLKTGASGKEIEMLYIEHNNFIVILTPILYDVNEIENTPPTVDNEGYFENSQMTGAFNQLIVIHA